MANRKIEYEITAVDKTKAALNSATRSVRGLQTAFSALAGIISAGTLVLATRRALSYADSIAKAGDRTGFATDQLQELRFAAEQTGVSVTELDGGLARFTKRLGLARAGTGAAADAYRKLGIDLNQTNREVFADVVETLGSIDDETNRLALTTRLFGDDAQRLAATFKDGNAGLKEYARQAHETGLIIDEGLLQGAEDASDALGRLGGAVTAQATGALAAMAPIITQVANSFIQATPAVIAFFDSFRDPENRLSIDGIQESILELESQLDDLFSVQQEINDQVSFKSTLDRIFGTDNASAEKVQQTQEILDKLQVLRDRLSELTGGSGALLTTPEAGDAANFFTNIKTSVDEAKTAVEDFSAPLQALRESLYTPEESENNRYENQLLALNEFLDESATSYAEYYELLAGLEEQHAENLKKINQGRAQDTFDAEKYIRDQKQTTFDMSINALRLFGTKYKAFALAALALEKGKGIANVIISTSEAVAKAFAQFGPVAGAPYAAAMKAMGAAQIALIAGTGIFQAAGIASSGGTTGVSGSSVGDRSFNDYNVPSEPTRTDISINLDGASLVSDTAVRELIEKINEAVDDGAVIGNLVVA